MAAAHSCPRHPRRDSPGAAPAGGPQGQPWFDPPQPLALRLPPPPSLQPTQLLLRALQGINKIIHPLAPLLWATHTPCPLYSLAITMDFIPPSPCGQPLAPRLEHPLQGVGGFNHTWFAPGEGCGTKYTSLIKHLMTPVAVLKDQPGS